jgi:transposase
MALPCSRRKRSCPPAGGRLATVAGVEPTNDAVERALRLAVLWRKGCFGADSAAGTVFMARLLTIGATCRQYQHPLPAFLTDAVAAHWAGVSGPSLLPTP